MLKFATPKTEDIDLAVLETKDGELTYLGQALDEFLSTQDFSQVETALAPYADDVVEGDEKTEQTITITIPGEIVAESLDLEDLTEDFTYWVEDVLAEDKTLTGKMMLRAVLEAHDYDGDITEFKKGDFKKMGAATRNRFLGAMIAKGAIKKVAKGKGYKKGDYQKNSGYPSGRGKSAKEGTETAPAAGTEKVDELITQPDAHNAGFGSVARWTRYKKSNKASVRKAAQKDKKSVNIRGTRVGGAATRIATVKPERMAAMAKKHFSGKSKSESASFMGGENLNENHQQFGTATEPQSATMDEAVKNQSTNFGRLLHGQGIPAVRPFKMATETAAK